MLSDNFIAMPYAGKDKLEHAGRARQYRDLECPSLHLCHRMEIALFRNGNCPKGLAGWSEVVSGHWTSSIAFSS